MTRTIAVGTTILSAVLLGSCDPGVHIAWEKDFNQPVDYDCIEQALKSVAPDVRRVTWTSDGTDPWDYPRGIVVTQFHYRDPNHLGGYHVNVARLPNGNTRFVHQWGKVGTDVPQDEQRKVLPLLNRANDAVAKKCGLSFSGVKPTEGDG